MVHRKKLALVAAAVLVSQTLAAEQRTDLGKLVFESNCTACHGVQGNGRGPASATITGVKPRDFTTGIFKYGSSDQEIFETITNGVAGTAMPSWKELSVSDRQAVVRYIKKFSKK